jgi:hypothetical protein
MNDSIKVNLKKKMGNRKFLIFLKIMVGGFVMQEIKEM